MDDGKIGGAMGNKEEEEMTDMEILGYELHGIRMLLAFVAILLTAMMGLMLFVLFYGTLRIVF